VAVDTADFTGATRADLGEAPTVLGWAAGVLELVVAVLFLITWSKRQSDALCRKASPALTMLVLASCAATLGVSWFWANDDITASEMLDVGSGCVVDEQTGISRSECSSCLARDALTVLSMTALWGAIVMRLLRTEALALSQCKGGTFSRLSSARVLILMGLGPLIGVQLVILIIYGAASQPILDHDEYPQKLRRTQAHWACWSPGSQWFWAMEFVLGAAALLYAAKVAKRTARVVKKNEEVDNALGDMAKQLNIHCAIAFALTIILAILIRVNTDEYQSLAYIRVGGLQVMALNVIIFAVLPLAKPKPLSLPGDDDDDDNDEDGEVDDGLDQDAPMILPKDMRDKELSEEMTWVLGAWEKKQKAKSGNTIRGAVSKKKRRYQRDGFDLDLTYITDRILAMGFPTEGKEAAFRNPMAEVQRFLELKHRQHYRVFNLCCEKDRQYDSSKFQDEVALFGFKDHNAPPLPLLLACCQDMDAWLLKDERNVCAIHCKAGKGRTGTVICAYFAYASQFDTTKDALDYYGRCRTSNGKGVTIPSQQRYIHYFAQCMHEGSLRQPQTVYLTHIHFTSVPQFDPDGGCQPYIVISRATWGNGTGKIDGTEEYGTELLFDSKQVLAVKHYRREHEFEFPHSDDLRLNVELKGDIFFQVCCCLPLYLCDPRSIRSPSRPTESSLC
jgi:phosphatidylinositol-3,4,5-trisphosphate 3-phosphatase/dual-specificity protein phosphatase PTEN